MHQVCNQIKACIYAGKTMLFTLAYAKSNKPAFDSNGKPLLNPKAIPQVRQTGNRWLPIRRRKYPIRQAGEVHGGVRAMVPTSYPDPSGSYARYGLYTICIVHQIYIMFPTCIIFSRPGTDRGHRKLTISNLQNSHVPYLHKKRQVGHTTLVQLDFTPLKLGKVT